jgi:hypothetical protein
MLETIQDGHRPMVKGKIITPAVAAEVTADGRYGMFSKILKFVMGGIILLIAFYMFYLGF